MKVLVAPSSIAITACCNKNPSLPSIFPSPFLKFPVSYKLGNKGLSFTPFRFISSLPTTETFPSSLPSNTKRCWMVVLEPPPQNVASSKQEFVDHCVSTLQRVLGSEKDAQMSIYDVFHGDRFGFCCAADEEASLQLSNLPGVISVQSELDYDSEIRDTSFSDVQIDNPANLDLDIRNLNLFPAGSSKHWLVRMDKPTIGIVSKAQMVDHYVQILTKVLGNESDAQMCIYHISWQSNFGFCCELDEECARELVGVPGVLSVQPDEHFDSENKNYRDGVQSPSNLLDASTVSETENVRTKKLFVTGLSFYTSEKTLRAAFEGFGELVEVKIIMDKISKRSKGYAFIEYTTEEAAGAALKEMNGKIINGWMIVVDVARPTPPKNSRDCQRLSV